MAYVVSPHVEKQHRRAIRIDNGCYGGRLPDVRPCILAVVGAFFHIVIVYGFQLLLR
jgi:hypothetical protein